MYRIRKILFCSSFLAEIPVVDPIVCLISMQSGCFGSFVVFDSLWSYLDVFCFCVVCLFELFLLSGPLRLFSFSFGLYRHM